MNNATPNLRLTRTLKSGLSIFALYFLIFIVPLFLYGWNSVYALAFTVSFCAMLLAFMILSHGESRSNIASIGFMELCIVVLAFAVCISILSLLGFADGINDRTLARGEKSNFNASALQMFNANLAFLSVAILAALLAWARRSGKRLMFFVGIFFCSYVLASSGTRFLFLLAISPLVYAILLKSKNTVKIFSVFLLLIFSAYIAFRRSTAALNFQAILFFDLPSTASYIAISKSEPSVGDIWYFFVGNILVLIPRSIFSNKPTDDAIIDFTVSVIGQDAFNYGSTYLPGFLGSSWLYGGLVGLLCLSLLLGWLVSSAVNYRVDDWKSETKAALLLVGVILQFRNVSVFYFLPFIYISLVFLMWTFLCRLKRLS